MRVDRWSPVAPVCIIATFLSLVAAAPQPKPVERRPRKRVLDFLRQIGGNFDRRLERARERTLQLALGDRELQRLAVDPDPCAPARRFRADIGRNDTVGPQCEPDQPRARGAITGKDALADRHMACRITVFVSG